MLKLFPFAAALAAFFITPAQAQPAQVDCLARVIAYEAGGEPEIGQKAVGFVVLNRTKSSKYPDTICGVVKQKGQFTGFKMKKPSRYTHFYDLARTVIREYTIGSDPTKGAVSFHSTSARPGWNLIKTVRIGGHIFYRNK